MHAWAIRNALSNRGWDFDHDLFVRHIVGNGDEHAFRMIASVNGHDLPLSEAEIGQMLRTKQELMLRGIAESRFTIQPGALEVVRRIAAIRPVGLCTGTVRATIEQMLRAMNLSHAPASKSGDRPPSEIGTRGKADPAFSDPIFRAVVCADDLTNNKPDPEGYLRASALLGVAGNDRRNCAAIEDSPTGVRAAHAAGLFVIAVGHTFDAEPLRLAGADAFIERLGSIDVE